MWIAPRLNELPDPEPLIANLARSTIELLAGVRDLDQLSRWISLDVYEHLVKRSALARRAREVKGVLAAKPKLVIGSINTCEPSDSVVESVVIVHGKARTRAVAIRLQAFEQRWRATAISVL